MTADATRLGSLRATTPQALERLLADLPDPPWDAEVASDDDLVAWMGAAGFERYATATVMARPLEGMASAHGVAGVRVGPYRNDWADQFTAAEAAALAESPIFQEMSQPTGYETADHIGGFIAATRGDRLIGFAQATMPQGWINWLGVVPDERRRGVGRALVAELVSMARDRKGTHLACLVDTESGMAFFRSLKFTSRGQRALLIRRA
jgi:GNAT superfamily N-acetyltransferase